MRVHLSASDQVPPRRLIEHAAAYASRMSGAPFYVDVTGPFGTRTHAVAFDVRGFSDGTLRRQRTADGKSFAATYDAWGHFMAYVFDVDPDAKLGTDAGAYAFDVRTDFAYTIDGDGDGESPDTCRDGVTGHWFHVTYGAAPYRIHARDCDTCRDEARAAV